MRKLAQMPHEPLNERLSREHRALEATSAIRLGQSDPQVGQIALVSGFGADSAVLLHLAAQLVPDMPVLFLDTGKHFNETLQYQRELASELGLQDLRTIKPDANAIAETDPYGALYSHAPDACCDLRKTQPLTLALKGFDGWITGRTRHQSVSRAKMNVFEIDGQSQQLKINPLAHWSAQDVAQYMRDHALLPHPLVARGFLSIGCSPCTSATLSGEDPRTGRWRGTAKDECGIHISRALKQDAISEKAV
jgi:phosphoadenosine phosphosulfate reductase